ncbi:MAG: stage III sporulation protein AF [Lachnospiraceae bacterium]|nr:stage III sporulation protein AF [Lachnospiraceae bacterium]
MNLFLEKIGQLSIFLICAQTLIHFRAKDSYEKYIKLLVSMMLLILLVEPVMSLLGMGSSESFMEQIESHEKQLQGILTTPQLKNEEITQILQNMTNRRVEESYAYMQQETEKGLETEVSSSAVLGEKLEEQKSTEHIEVQVTIEKIEEVKIGADNGESGKNP